jgi:hypothetical protein
MLIGNRFFESMAWSAENLVSRLVCLLVKIRNQQS